LRQLLLVEIVVIKFENISDYEVKEVVNISNLSAIGNGVVGCKKRVSKGMVVANRILA
jgi:hypothetical protein